MLELHDFALPTLSKQNKNEQIAPICSNQETDVSYAVPHYPSVASRRQGSGELLFAEQDTGSGKVIMMAQIKSWEQVAGKWKQFSSKVKKQWGNLTDDELMQVNGRREILAAKIQEKYGVVREEADRQIDEWASKL
jgi:uncharacterized protein YjbJ (UPF0337 family)